MSKLALKIEAQMDKMLSPLTKFMASVGSPDEIQEEMGLGQENKDGKKVLVGYYTRHGSTTSVAKTLSEQFVSQGFQVDLRFINNIPEDEDLSKYDVFVLGSAIYWSALTEEFNEFVVRNESLLSQKPTAIFSVSMSMQRDNHMNRERMNLYMDKTLTKIPSVDPVRLGLFAGAFDFAKVTKIESVLMGMIFKYTPLNPGDHLDPPKVKSWVKEVIAAL